MTPEDVPSGVYLSRLTAGSVLSESPNSERTKQNRADESDRRAYRQDIQS